MTEIPYAFEMRGIVKRFPGVLANDRIDFAVRAGEIHALLGENGAGKSTLMNVLAGLYRPESGEILIDGRPIDFNSPRDAIRHGVGMVHQHFMLVPTLTVAENLILGLEQPRFVINQRHIERHVAELSQKFGLAVDPAAKVWQLSVGEQQRVEVLKVLYHGARVLIMDEPTAVLTPQEVEELFKTLRSMVASGHTVVFISHKLDEVLVISDRITVLRYGRKIATVEARETNKAELARMMVGRSVLFRLERKPAQPGEVVLDVRDLHCENDRGLPALRGVSLAVRAGEIVGLAGVAGNGQSELAQVITGLRPATRGRVSINGRDVTNQPANAAAQQGLAHVPEDRTGVGTAPNLSLADNLILKTYSLPPIGSGWRINLAEVRRQAEARVREFDVVAPGIETAARLLSGGNLQRLILARELSLQPKVLIAVQPTRGLDVGAIESVHQLLIKQRDDGAAILLISEELDEITSLADRIVVIFGGQIAGEMAEADLEAIGQMMAGVRRMSPATPA